MTEQGEAMERTADEIERLRSLLREYGRHAEGCSASCNAVCVRCGMMPDHHQFGAPCRHYVAATYPCKCGWDEVKP